MERVERGEKYWYIYDRFEVSFSIEDSSPISNKHFETHNYFHTEEQAESMARKLRAVLKGADVIEMPSEDELREELTRISEYNEAMAHGASIFLGRLKSKIVK